MTDASLPLQADGWSQRLQTERQTVDRLKAEYANPSQRNTRELKRVAQQFEGVFIKQLLEAMDKTIQRDNSLFSGGSAEEKFRGMLYDEMSNNMASRAGGSGLGLAEEIYRQSTLLMAKEPSAQQAESAPTEGAKP
ncbi:MAG: rod-binding protein [Candidatus Melainabacteria bacterium]|nr:rod-binding protein [Candidatus Melainabacteria bacterium]